MALSYDALPRLHLPRSSYDLFVYDFPYDFFSIVDGYKLRRMCVYIAYDHLTISFGDKLGQILQRPCRYRMTTARLSCNHRVIFTTSYKSHDARTMTLRSRKESVR